MKRIQLIAIIAVIAVIPFGTLLIPVVLTIRRFSRKVKT